MDKAPVAKHLVGNVDALCGLAGEGALRNRLRLCARGRVAIERDFVGEFPITRPDIAWTRDGAVLDLQYAGLDAKPLGRCRQKYLPDFGAGVSQRPSGVLDRQAARGNAFIRTGN